MPFSYSIEEYCRYRDKVGPATVIDITRRADPARVPAFWGHVREILTICGAPWVVQIWSKDPSGVLGMGRDVLRDLCEAGTILTAQITITGLAGTVWEPLVPQDALQGLAALAEAMGGPEHITWRYDPIIPTVHSSLAYRNLAQRVSELGIWRGVINFLAPPGRYSRVDRRLQALLPSWPGGMPGYDDSWRLRVAEELVAIAGEVGIRLACCAEYAYLHDRVANLGPAACGEHAWFATLSGEEYPALPSRGSRPGCGCARYYDVGSYGHWARCHRCVYCYAG